MDLATVDALARMALAARRLGCGLEIERAPAELRELLELAGLARVVRCPPAQAGRRGGRPNSGKSRSVSRKKVNPAIPSPEGSRTSSDHGS